VIDCWTGKRVTVMGLGRFEGGVAVTRWLCAQGARVLVTDRDPAEKLEASLKQIDGLDVALRLGGHDAADFANADVVVVNPAVPESSPYLAAARAKGVPITTEINLFLERCRARTVGITGSVGKSTTTSMVAHALERSLRGRRILLGGNIGRSLLDELPALSADDIVVLELSSFQLERTPPIRWSPHVAVLTNLSPNHLDWHGSFDAYAAAKMNIAKFQSADDFFVVGDDVKMPHVQSAAQRWTFGADSRAWSRAADGRRVEWPDVRLEIPGRHNVVNAAAALTVAHVLGADAKLASASLASLAALPHRLERVATVDGVTYYNDSKATTPEAAITAIESIDAPLLLILGGYDKGSDLTPVAELAAARARFSACVGKTGPALLAGIRERRGRAEFFETFEDAVAACRREAQRGDTVLLSPACASWGMFEDYRQRGDVFRRLVTRDGA
jgi:UDP-N-acetylmuramoylalanine--D-glutamate ligase